MIELPATLVGAQIPEDLRALAHSIVIALLHDDHRVAIGLRNQLDAASVRSVELTGAGAFVNYDVPSHVPPVEPPTIRGGHVELAIDGLARGAGSVLFVENGRLDCLEIFTYAEEWPLHPVLREMTTVALLTSSGPFGGLTSRSKPPEQ